MGSNLSCVEAESGPASTADNVYDEASTAEGPTNSTSPSQPATTTRADASSVPLPSATSKQHQPAKEQHSSSSSSSNSDNNHNTTVKQITRGPPLVPPPNPNVTKNDRNKTNNKLGTPHIIHDSKGYALVIPKPGNTSSAASGTSSNSSELKEKTVQKLAHKNGNVLPTGSGATCKDGEISQNQSKENGKSKAKQVDTGAYCNVTLGDDKETRSFSNELYDDTELHVPKVPANTRKAAKVPDAQEKSKGSQLNYIEVEFVSPAEDTSKRPKVKRSASPTQYTDVINENGVVRLVN
ncbi:hypothetical protein ElyMa_001521000 [Elysia marginata]|uniref:Uncharacterized protein n=2 Tax=Elysia marginata TaxID=1093978 RepID=A0AAV4JCQ7_9GAST|nr:hypothetical protein ElyMa_001521000 [Elysia marginata]